MRNWKWRESDSDSILNTDFENRHSDTESLYILKHREKATSIFTWITYNAECVWKVILMQGESSFVDKMTHPNSLSWNLCYYYKQLSGHTLHPEQLAIYVASISTFTYTNTLIGALFRIAIDWRCGGCSGTFQRKLQRIHQRHLVFEDVDARSVLLHPRRIQLDLNRVK